MDFGSFLRQRLRNLGGANADDYASPQGTWNEPFDEGNQFMDDRAVSRDPHNDFFDVDGDPSHWERRNDIYDQHNYHDSMNPDQQDGPWFASRGRGTNRVRGRGQIKRTGDRGRRHPAMEGGWDIESDRGFGQESHRGGLRHGSEENVFFDWPTNDGDNAFGIGNEHPVENKDVSDRDMAKNSSGLKKEGHDGNDPVHFAEGNPEVHSTTQKVENNHKMVDVKEDGMQPMACDGQKRSEKRVERSERNKELPDSGRDGSDKKMLADFDVTQVSINWAHFGITKGMLKEASEEGKYDISKKKNFDTSKLEFYCKLCDVQTVSAGNFCDHLTGKRHKCKVEYEVDKANAAETVSTELDEQECKTYGGLIGMEELVKAVNEDSLESKEKDEDIDIKLEIDNRYEKRFYDEFDITQFKLDWEANGITESMLKEASMDSKEVKYEDKACDVFKLQFYCRLCDVQSRTELTFKTHLVGKKHINKVARLVKIESKEDTDGGTKEAEEDRIMREFDIMKVDLLWDHIGITKDMLKEASTIGIPGISRKKKTKEIDVTKLEFYCKLCAAQMVSAGNFYDHLVGKRHKSNYQEHMKFLSSLELKSHPLDMELEELGEKSIFEGIFADDKAVVGLSYILELHSIYRIWCICRLCGCRFNGHYAKDHIYGIKHRVMYMRKEHPGVYNAVKEKYNLNKPYNSFVEEMALKREESDGRGTSTIKRYDKALEGDIELATQDIPCDDTERLSAHFERIQKYISWAKTEFDEVWTEFWKQFDDRPPSPFLKSKFKYNKEESDDKPQDFFEHPVEVHDKLLHRHPRRELSPHPRHELPPHRRHELPPHHRHDLPPHLRREGLLPHPRHELPPHPRHELPPHPRHELPPHPRHELPPHPRHELPPHPRHELPPHPRHELHPYPRHELPPHSRHDLPPHLRDFPPELLPHPRHEFSPELPLHPRHVYPQHEHFPSCSSHSPPPRFIRERPNLREDAPIPHYPPYHDMPHDRDPYFNMRNDPRIPAPYLDLLHRSHNPEKAVGYLDPDPLKRILKSKAILTPDPLKHVHSSEPYIDPDPLKRVLPSQKAKLKPVVIDYSHGKQEKSDKTKAEEWENDLNDILLGSKVKGPDSLSLLSSSYSSPKREKSPSETKLPARELPFSKSYLERATLKAIGRSPDRKSEKRSGKSKSPEYMKFRKLSSHPKRPSRSSRSPPYRSPSPSRSTNPQTFKFSKNSKRLKNRSKSPVSPPPRSRSPYGRHRKSRSPIGLPSSRSPVDPPSRNTSPPRSKHHFVTPRTRNPIGPPKPNSPPVPPARNISPPGHPRSRSPVGPPGHPRSRSPVGPPGHPRSRSPVGPPGHPRSRSPVGPPGHPRSRSPVGPPRSKNKSPLDPPPSRSPLGPPRTRSPLDPPRTRSPLDPPRSRSPLDPPRTRSPLDPPRTRSPLDPPRTRSPLDPPRTRSPVSLKPVTTSKTPESSGYSSMPQTSGISSRSPIELPKTVKPAAEGRRKESLTKKPPVSQPLDDDAQADMIANMLLNMKHSIVGSEIEDPHAALQALLSSKDLAEALLAAKSESTSYEVKNIPSPEQGREISRQTIKRKASPPQSTSTREKITFSFQGKGSLPTRNVPQTFIEEDSEEEN